MSPDNKIKEHIIDHLTGEQNPSDELNEWKNQSPENDKTLSDFQKIWRATDFVSNMQKFDSKHAWRKVGATILREQKRKTNFQKAIYAFSGMAASLILVFSLTIFNQPNINHQNPITLSTENGSKAEITLPDGTEVTLNSGSSISYLSNLSDGIRDVSFSGEAFFKVAKSKVPFVVQTASGMKLKVLGTQFNLSTYAENNHIETTLLEGKVELTSPNGNNLILEPGQMGSYNQSTQNLAYKIGTPSHEIGWLNNKIYLDNTSLESLTSLLERQFNVQILLVPTKLGTDIHYTGVLEEKTITDILDALTQLSDIKYKIKGTEIIISAK
ncbi:FecR family protein [Plebeiibacterium marinum]|uniref:FecR domain-containing protein n=1 Tax=Plebeiibacterium marinum TaxID=2992111 RepID=A0AAE3MCN5_9BACT|nr:FecR domain-containing protein [Plebeiobacterium marinum]MCW3805503.1 FecR domain-containing protein [Plebeiobacterium marinum]